MVGDGKGSRQRSSSQYLARKAGEWGDHTDKGW